MKVPALIRAFVVATSPMIRVGVRAMLDEPVEITGESAGFEQQDEELTDIDVLIVGDEAQMEELADWLPPDDAIALVVLSTDPSMVATIRKLPVEGWAIVSPLASASELQAAVVAAAEGLVVLPMPLADSLLPHRATVASLATQPLEEALTARELEVLALLSEGLSNKMIARELQISDHTVKFHLSSLYGKLGAASRADAVSRAARQGLITL